mmetsp:Transcript_21376/g.60193  ORF Transcript_21376/g.60193 Transcript_21376/m.60193 type:complete len:483 (-) Transcript_21376:641-2089(-)
MVREGDGRWLVPEALGPLMKPGGHGVIWKLMLDNDVFGWFRANGRKGGLLRQISNPLAGTDDTLLALAGQGLGAGAAFGFASCERKVGASEGCNVLMERRLPGRQGTSYCVTNVEYTEFARLGIQDQDQSGSWGEEDGDGTSAFPANTNILYVGLDQVERKVMEGAAQGYAGAGVVLPGMLVNLKKTTTFFCRETRADVSHRAGRLECTMQNIADSLAQVLPEPAPPEASPDLDTFLIFNGRSKVTSSAKKRRKEGPTTEASLRQTPDGSFLDLMRNGKEVLELCGFSVPDVGGAAEYVERGPGFIFLFHPALGPLWHVIAQKVRGGSLAPGSELVLEIAEADVQDLALDGSLVVRAERPMGHLDESGLLKYSQRCGRCRLVDVRVENAGVDWGNDANVYWQHHVERLGGLHVLLEGDAEFEAVGVTFQGSHEFVVPPGHKMVVTQKEDGSLVEDLRASTGPSWAWVYQPGGEGVQLSKALQ